METLEQLQNDGLTYETGLDVLQLGLSEQGFGDVEIPSLDEGSVAEHRGRLTGAMAAIAVGSLALAAPAAVSAEQTNAATGIVVTATTEQYNPNQVDYVKVLPLKYRKINSRCGVEPFKVSSTAGELKFFGALITSNTAPKKYRYTQKVVATLDETGIKIPVRVCHIKNFPSAASLVMSAEGKDFIFKNYVFNWPKKKWIARR